MSDDLAARPSSAAEFAREALAAVDRRRSSHPQVPAARRNVAAFPVA